MDINIIIYIKFFLEYYCTLVLRINFLIGDSQHFQIMMMIDKKLFLWLDSYRPFPPIKSRITGIFILGNPAVSMQIRSVTFRANKN